MSIEAVIFDLDGTLVHSEAVAARAVAEVFARHGVMLDESHARAVTGKTWGAALDAIASRTALPALSRDELLQQILSQYRVKLAHEVDAVPGSVEAVRSLAGGFKLGLVSGSYREEILFALGKLQIAQHFQPILGAEDYPRSKPAPDGYLSALSQMGVHPSKALVFEDSEPGIQSALAAGCQVVVVRHCQSLSPQSLWLRRAHALIDTLEGVTPQWVHERF